MKYTITVQEMPGGMLKIDFDPTIPKIMTQLERVKKATAAEEMVLRVYEFIQNKSIKEQRAQLAAKSKIILPNANGTLPMFN